MKLKSFIGFRSEPDNLGSIGIFTLVSKMIIAPPISEISGFTPEDIF